MNMPKGYKIYGVATNDADYVVSTVVNGVRKTCPYYRAWKGMLGRAYCPKRHKRSPSYADVTVCDEWLLFSNFKAWMAQQDWKNKHLDKDIIVPGNKVYGPDTCCFVEPRINTLLTFNERRRGDLPLGVHYSKQDKSYLATCRKADKGKMCLGHFKTPSEAHDAYVVQKVATIVEAADQQNDARIARGLRAHAARLMRSHRHD